MRNILVSVQNDEPADRQIKLNYTPVRKSQECHSLSPTLLLQLAWKGKVFYKPKRSLSLTNICKGHNGPLRFSLAHWYRRHSDGLEVGLRNTQLDESEVPPGPRSLVSGRGGGAETSNHQAAEGTWKDDEGPLCRLSRSRNLFVFGRGKKKRTSLCSFSL